MKEGNKLQTYFKAFSKKDWNQFGLFLNSPFFNSISSLIQLFNFFFEKKERGGFDKMLKEEVFAYVYPDQAFKVGQLRTLFWRMGKLVETFLAVSNLTNDENAVQDQLIWALGKKNEWFHLLEKRINAKTKKESQKAVEFKSLLDSVKLHHQLYFHEDFRKYKSGYLEIRRLVEDLDQFIALAKLKYHCELLFRRQILKEEEGQSLLPDVVLNQILKSMELQNETPVLFIYAKLIRMKQSGDFQLYDEIKQEFQEFQAQINREDRQSILLYLINFIIYMDKRQEVSLYGEMLNLYQIGIESGILIMHNHISYDTFVNIAILGSTQKKFVWTDMFIRKYQELLEPSIAGLAIKLVRAYWNFHQGKYKKVLEWAIEIDIHEEHSDDPFRLRALRLRAYYELYRQDKSFRRLLYNFIESFSKFIKNNRRRSRTQAAAYLNFVRLLNQLFKKQTKDNFDHSQKQKLLVEATDTNPLVLKNWLLEKIKEC